MRMVILMFAITFCASTLAADPPRATDFKWMSGCWGYESGGSSYEEHWLAPIAMLTALPATSTTCASSPAATASILSASPRAIRNCATA
jgi:hypothetical protein